MKGSTPKVDNYLIFVTPYPLQLQEYLLHIAPPPPNFQITKSIPPRPLKNS